MKGDVSFSFIRGLFHLWGIILFSLSQQYWLGGPVGNAVDLRKRETCDVPLSGETGRLAFRTQGGATLTLGYNIKPFQGKKPPPKGVHILAQGKLPLVHKTIGPHSSKGI